MYGCPFSIHPSGVPDSKSSAVVEPVLEVPLVSVNGTAAESELIESVVPFDEAEILPMRLGC